MSTPALEGRFNPREAQGDYFSHPTHLSVFQCRDWFPIHFSNKIQNHSSLYSTKDYIQCKFFARKYDVPNRFQTIIRGFFNNYTV